MLVIMGILGVMASIFLAIVEKEIGSNIPSFIASISLLYLGVFKVEPKAAACPVEVKETKDPF